MVGYSDFKLVAELQQRTEAYLTGGATVQLYTEEAFRTRNVDLVSSDPSSVGKELERMGFVKIGPSWFREKDRKIIDVLWDKVQRPRVVAVADLELRTASLEYLIADRLNKCRAGLRMACRKALELLDRYGDILDRKFLEKQLEHFGVDRSFPDEQKLERLITGK